MERGLTRELFVNFDLCRSDELKSTSKEMLEDDCLFGERVCQEVDLSTRFGGAK
jgi:hypothetical protein